MEHNFEKYTRGEVISLPANKNFYDFDVSKTPENIHHVVAGHIGRYNTILVDLFL